MIIIFLFFQIQSLQFPEGGIIHQKNSTYFHVFLSNGFFKLPEQIIIKNAEIFMVGGGGSGNKGYSDKGGGGGGAGGVLLLSNVTLNLSSYSITIGKGGINGLNGENTYFNNFIAYGGGGCNYKGNGNNGGSGGGAGKSYETSNSGGLSILNQGQSGGNAPYPGHGGSGGGGGGYSQPGSHTTSYSLSNGYGGNGIIMTEWLQGLSYGHYINNNYYFAGGGGGGQPTLNNPISGGYGGGGNGRGTSNGENGLTNSGGGGGGSRTGNGGNGGSGIVIIKYNTFYFKPSDKKTSKFQIIFIITQFFLL